MARRRLSPDEVQLWKRVVATVKPMAGQEAAPVPDPALLPEVKSAASQSRTVPAPAPTLKKAVPPKPARSPNQSLDANWDKRIATGKAAPDRTIDLHGHTAASAHALLNTALGDAIRSGARVMLLITGRPASDNPRMPPTGRGVIRASVEDWLMAGPHASKIAAIRKAHPRHGGAGALYLILRRERG